MTAKEIIDFVMSWLEAGQVKRAQTFSEVAVIGKFGTEGHFNHDDVEDLYQYLAKLDEIDAVLVIKCILEKLNFVEPPTWCRVCSSILDSVMSSHDNQFDKTVIKILHPFLQPLSPTPVSHGRIKKNTPKIEIDYRVYFTPAQAFFAHNPMRSVFDQRWAEVKNLLTASTVS